jgi:hypothetical protein
VQKCLLKNQDEKINEIEMAARAALEDTHLTSNFKRENNLLNKSSNAVGAFPLVLALFQYRTHTCIYCSQAWIGAMASTKEPAATRRSGESHGVTLKRGEGPPWMICGPNVAP